MNKYQLSWLHGLATKELLRIIRKEKRTEGEMEKTELEHQAQEVRGIISGLYDLYKNSKEEE